MFDGPDTEGITKNTGAAAAAGGQGAALDLKFEIDRTKVVNKTVFVRATTKGGFKEVKELKFAQCSPTSLALNPLTASFSRLLAKDTGIDVIEAKEYTELFVLTDCSACVFDRYALVDANGLEYLGSAGDGIYFDSTT